MKKLNYLLLLLFTTCSTQKNCGRFEDTNYPVDAVVLNNSVHVELMQEGLKTVVQALPVFINRFIADQPGFSVQGDFVVYSLNEDLLSPYDTPFFLRDGCEGKNVSPCVSKTPVSTIKFKTKDIAQNLKMEWLANDSQNRPGLRLTFSNLTVYLNAALKVNFPALFPTSVCHIFDNGQGALRIARVVFEIRLSSQEVAGHLQLAPVIMPPVIDLRSGQNEFANIQIEPCNNVRCQDNSCLSTGCESFCKTMDSFAAVGGLFEKFLQPLIDGFIPELTELLQEQFANELKDLTLHKTGKISVYPWEIFLNLGLAQTPKVVDAQTLSQFQMGFNLGVMAPKNKCIPQAVLSDPLTLLGPKPNYSGYVRVKNKSTPEAYHAAFFMSEANLAQILQAAFSGGLMCMGFDSYEIAEATENQFVLESDLIRTLVGIQVHQALPEKAPMLVTISPKKPPRIYLGADGPIGAEANEPLIDMHLDDFALNLYVLMDESPVRLVELLTDAHVQLGIERSLETGVQLVVHELKISNVRQVYNELIPEADLSTLVQVLADTAISVSIGNNLRFPVDFTTTLQTTLKIPLEIRVNAVRRDLGPTGAKYLSLFVSFCNSEDVKNSSNALCFKQVPMTTQSNFSVKQAALGQVVLNVQSSELREYQARVDGHMWGPFSRALQGRLIVKSPQLLLTGKHTVEIRERRLDDLSTLQSKVEVKVEKVSDAASSSVDSESSDGCQQTSSSFIILFLLPFLFFTKSRLFRAL